MIDRLPRFTTLVALGLFAVACGSDPATTQPEDKDPAVVQAPPGPDAPTIDDGPKGTEVTPDPNSTSRPLAWVNGEVVTYRDVLREVGPQLKALQNPDQRRQLEDPALLRIVRQRVIYQAARAAGVPVRQTEIEEEVSAVIRDLEKTGGTLEAFLRERDWTRREFEESLRRDIASQKFMYHSIGRGTDPNVIVRPRADTYVSPQEVRNFYDRNPEKFREAATAQFRMLMARPDRSASDRARAAQELSDRLETMRSALASGEDWVPLYREFHGETDERDNLDGLHTITRDESKHAEWITSFAFDSEKGTVSEVIRKGSTFVLLYAEGARPARQIPFEEVQNLIRSELGARKRAAAAYEVELDLLKDAAIDPEPIRDDLRTSLRDARRKLLEME